MTFAGLTRSDIGKTITALAKVERVFQSSGPTFFTLFDGSASLTSKAFLKPGSRAYPQIVSGDVVKAVLRIREYEGQLEGEIVSMEKGRLAEFESQAITLKEKKVKVEYVPFLAKSEWLDKLRPRFEKAAGMIKNAIYEKRPIIVRHNADCDGYSGAIALERAILPLILEHHNEEYVQWRYYRRAPSKAPYYAYGDAVLDLVMAINDMMKWGVKEPLIIVVDNGSGKEDLLAIEKVKIYGCQVIVVDHHFVGEDVISSKVDVHINPYLAGYDNRICSGMLGVELARVINPEVENINFLAALSGMGDKIKGEEMNQYVALAAAEGYDAEYLKQIALCVDFEAHYLRFIEGRGLVDDLLGADKEKQKQMVSLLYKEARGRIDKLLEAVKHYIEVEEVDGRVIAKFDLDKLVFLGDFPAFGKVTGAVSDWLNEKHKKAVYVLGISSEMIVLRVSESEKQFNLNEMIAEMKKKFKYANMSGGGHERAGTVKFLSAAKDEVVKFVLDYVKRS